MSLTYRNTGAWGSGKGARLTSLEGDNNIYTLDQRLAAIEVDSGGKTIDYFAQDVHTGQLYIHYTDHSIDGPFDLPTMEWDPTGPYLGDNAYQKNQIFFIDGSLYLVLRDHTSPSHFDAFANDGSGHDFYALILMNPGNVIPDGGTTGQVLAKVSDHDFDTDWIDLLGIPIGGTTGQYLTKTTDHDGDTEWSNPPVPNGGTTGQILAKTNDHDGEVEWIDQLSLEPMGSSALSTSGSVGIDTTLGNIFTLTPTADCSLFVADATLPPAGRKFTIIITTSGTTNYNITYSGIVAQGTLATGTVNGKRFTVSFAVNSAGLPYETSRTTAM